MCTGAIINSRIRRLVYGASDYKAGSCGSVVNLFDLPYNHKPELSGGVLEEECAELLSSFFKKLRKKD
jgi:tRNA(adenine34) deaminase